MTATIDQFEELLAAFKKLPPTPDPTTLEISGYPHWEKVYSNILAFFLDPGREHGFGSLFLESLLSIAKYEAIQDSEEVEVKTEEYTGTRKRIDLVISTDTLIVGIENKIYNPVHNDLKDYGQRLDALANGQRRVCKLLLGLNLPNDDQELFGFKPVTYQGYFDEILRRIGPTLIGSSGRYLRFVLEVIETVKHLTEGSAMKPEMLDFFSKHTKDIESLIQEIKNLKDDMRRRIQAIQEDWDISDLQGQYRRTIEAKVERKTGELWDNLICDITIEDDFILCIETTIYPSEWEICAWPKQGSPQRVDSWFEAQNGPRTFPYDADPSEVAAQLRHLLESAMTDPFPKPQ